MTIALGEFTNEQLLELLYLLPSRNPLAGRGDLDDLFGLFSFVAPELREMVERFDGRAGRVCDEYRILASIGNANR